MATENLKVKITADASQAKAEIGKFKDSLKGVTSEGEGSVKSLKDLKSTMNNLKSAIHENLGAMVALPAALRKIAIGAGAVIVAFKAIKGLINNALQVAEMGDEIKDNAQKVFMGTTAYQEWGYVLKQNGLEMANLKTGMRQFSQLVASGNGVLAKYGVTATDVDTAFEQAVYSIQNMSTETEKITAATELFGARALELMPIFNMTNAETQGLMETYRALGGTMSNELIAASDLCSDSITEMKMAWGGLRNLLATYVIPIVTKVVQWITVAIAKIRILLAAIFGVKETFGGGGGNKKTSLPATSGAVAANTGGTANNLKRAAKHAKELRRTLMGIDELSRLAEKATAAAAGGGGGGVGGVGGGSIDTSGLEGIDDTFSSETLDKIEAFRQKIENLKERFEGIKLIASGLKDILMGNFDEGIEKLREGIEKAFPKITELREKWEDIKTKVKSFTATAKIALNNAFTAAWNKVKGVWWGIKNKTATLKIALSNAFSSAWNKVKGAWNGIKSKTATIKLKFTEKIKSVWNRLAEKVNSARNKSAFARTMLPNMPYLARGGVLTMPTAAVMGEYAGARQNPEIATPQSLMYETIQKANGDMVSAFASMTRQVIAAIEDKDLNVSIGDEQIARSAQRGNTAYYNRTGKALLSV